MEVGLVLLQKSFGITVKLYTWLIRVNFGQGD